jgi:hypothetical protein
VRLFLSVRKQEGEKKPMPSSLLSLFAAATLALASAQEGLVQTRT